jgi:asparagine synthase (glutamine-hydrolysing)
MKKGRPKAYLKKVAAPILPDTILSRPKSGFQVASHNFFHSHLGDIATEQLSEQKIKTTGLFNYDFVKHVLKFRPSKRLRWHYFILYFMILTHLWIDLFESESWPRKP